MRTPIVVCVTAVLAWAGTGCVSEEEEQRRVDLGHGLIVEVPADLEGKDLLVESLHKAYDEKVDLLPEVEECASEKIEAAPEAEFEKILALPRLEQQRASLQFSNKYVAECVESGDNIVPTDADAFTVRLLRETYVGQLTLGLQEGGGVPPNVESCITNQFRVLSDPEIIELVNSTYKEQENRVFDAARSCSQTARASL